jgi:predicted transcriptional regulator
MKNTAQKKTDETNEAAEFEAAVREGLAEADAGKTIPYAKIRRWLLSWGSDKELPPPK